MKYYSNGKLLITGEYLVLDGAKSLALPTIFGQSLNIESISNHKEILAWKSYDFKKEVWFTSNFKLTSLQISHTSDNEIALALQKILLEARNSNPNFLKVTDEIQVVTTLNFDRNWGLGTSSTLINNIASWAKIDAFKLQLKTFGGSAYDIACAQNNTPILYQLKSNRPKIEKINFNPDFKNNLYFIYINKKQNSRNAIQSYRTNKIDKSTIINEITDISNQVIQSNSIAEFEFLIKKHEEIVAKVIGIIPIQKRLFPDYSGQIKSLGAWGGDFILATGNETTSLYFKNKGFQTIIPYSELIL